jgi:large conductance mechanosensitive channel
MKDMVAEFKAFISKGDIVMIAAAFVMALYFKAIIDQIVAGVIQPIIAAIVGESSLADFGFDIGDARISIGLVIQAIIDFIIVALVLFFIVKAYNRWRRDEEAAGPSEVELLTDIRDELRARNAP